MSNPSMIAIDWGSSAFRAFLLAENSDIIARISTDDGVLQSSRKPFDQTIDETCGRWLKDYGPLPIVMSGMIGSRNGWVETEYTPCPTSIDSLSKNLVSVPKQEERLQIVPGVSGTNLFGSPDVMRGEEVQVLGALDILKLNDAIVCLPGTHSKWCIVKSGQIQSLTTFMTGEMFALIRGHSSIGPLITDDEFDLPSFTAGVDAGRSSAGLLNKLFSVRAGVLLDTLECQSRASYLSGMFIGREIKAVIDALGSIENVILVGNEGLTHRYASALEDVHVHATMVDVDRAFLNGIALIANT